MEENQEFDDFSAGFDGTATPTPQHVEETAAPKLAQITEEQFTELLSKATAIDEIKAEQKKNFDAAFGKIGGLQQLLEQLKTSSGVEVSVEDFEELKEEYPEMAELHVKGLNKALSKLRGGAIDTTKVEALITTKVAEARTQFQKQMEEERIAQLSEDHEDWQQVVQDEKFLKWKEALNEKERERLNNSWNPNFISKKLTEYKKSLESPPPKKSNRQEVIDAAVQPRGAGGPPPGPSDEDEFNAGFASG